MKITVIRPITILIITALIAFTSQSFRLHDDDHKKDKTNLKVLPKKISGEELHAIMKEYSKSLGVKCGYCHVSTGEGEQRKWNFESDEKKTKLIARSMIKMTMDINKKYISKMGNVDKISCVTCHNGTTTPITSVDSLMKK